MRWIAALVLAGLCSTLAVLPGCLARETPSGDPPPLPEGTVLPYIDPLQICLDACFLSSTLCGDATDWCIDWCGNAARAAGPMCQKEFADRYACELARFQAQEAANMPECPQYLRCHPKSFYDCLREHGCSFTQCGGFFGQPTQCNCAEVCLQRDYRSECVVDGMTTTCECYIDFVLVGTCDGGAELFCDEDLTKSCCNQYFMLTF